MKCRTESNAFEKFNEMTITHELTDRRLVTTSSRVMIAAVVDQVGRNANWSEKISSGHGGDAVLDKIMYCLTTIRSMTRVRTGVIDIGRKSAGCCGVVSFEIGLSTRLFPLDWNGGRAQ